MTPGPSRSPAPETRDRILDAAEGLFVEHGFEATSMRMITSRAGANIAAVNYHFGTKDALIQEVFGRRLTELNRQRLAALDRLQAEAKGEPLKPSRIVEAFFGTALELAADTEHGGHTFMRLLGRTYTEPNAFVRKFMAEEYAEVLERFLGALYGAL
ncbi:MAG: TetR family transcriptional regulator, partial [Betaproteobacteria bacterium HGW-Betaproteobacteria-21]